MFSVRYQLLPGSFEHQPGEAKFQGFVDLFEHFASGGEGGGEIAAHADGLAALAWKDEGMHRHETRAPNEDS